MNVFLILDDVKTVLKINLKKSINQHQLHENPHSE